jgi:hypothetical protein
MAMAFVPADSRLVVLYRQRARRIVDIMMAFAGRYIASDAASAAIAVFDFML